MVIIRSYFDVREKHAKENSSLGQSLEENGWTSIEVPRSHSGSSLAETSPYLSAFMDSSVYSLLWNHPSPCSTFVILFLNFETFVFDFDFPSWLPNQERSQPSFKWVLKHFAKHLESSYSYGLWKVRHTMNWLRLTHKCHRKTWEGFCLCEFYGSCSFSKNWNLSLSISWYPLLVSHTLQHRSGQLTFWRPFYAYEQSHLY